MGFNWKVFSCLCPLATKFTSPEIAIITGMVYSSRNVHIQAKYVCEGLCVIFPFPLPFVQK